MYVIKYKAKGKSEGLSFYPSLYGFVCEKNPEDIFLLLDNVCIRLDIEQAKRFKTKQLAEKFASENLSFENDTHDISVEYIEV